jgi:hypothetical protein
MSTLILKHASASRPSGEWNDDDFDVLADGAVVGRIFKANAAPVGSPWMWTLAFGQHEDRTPTHGYAETREAAMAAFAKSWGRGWAKCEGERIEGNGVRTIIVETASRFARDLMVQEVGHAKLRERGID